MTSVVIAAHNEGAVIGRCLDALAQGVAPGELDITVVANGCTDDTADRASRHAGVRVLDVARPGKSNALNEGDRVAVGFPRVYLDADIVLTGGDLRRLCAALSPSTPAAMPARRLDLSGRPLVVRAYYTIQRHLPAFTTGLFGRGAIALSEAGRARFERFPDLVADDLFLDSLFTAAEKRQVADVVSVVATPRRTADLLARLVRVRRGNADLRTASGAGSVAGAVRPPDRMSWLRDVVLRRPWLAPAGGVYAAVTLYAARLASRPAEAGQEWGRDESSRQVTR